jgi:thiol-disulfide isomerase/thioredoxin
MNMRRNTLLIVVLIVIAGAIYFLNAQKASKSDGDTEVVEVGLNVIPGISGEDNEDELSKVDNQSATNIAINIDRIEEKQKKFEKAKEITTPDGFINTNGQPITLSELVGKKIILVDFWTYSCINCQRTTPYLNAWYEKYKDQGLEIVGIHTPEFEFEKKYENVLMATKQFGIKYPIVLDNDYSTWRAYQNQYWPRKYLIDIDGFIVYDHIGEGAYAETEKKIQELLEERMGVLGESGQVAKNVSVPSDAESVNMLKVQSPEVYFGSSRNIFLGNGPQRTVGVFSFEEPKEILTNVLYLVGDWEITPEYAEAKSDGARIIFKYQASKVFMVAGAEGGLTARVRRDGKIMDGIDGLIGIKEEMLYRLIEGEYGSQTLDIMFMSPGVRVFTFTFG